MQDIYVGILYRCIICATQQQNENRNRGQNNRPNNWGNRNWSYGIVDRVVGGGVALSSSTKWSKPCLGYVTTVIYYPLNRIVLWLTLATTSTERPLLQWGIQQEFSVNQLQWSICGGHVRTHFWLPDMYVL